MNRKIAYLILAIFTATYLVGCGDSDKPSASVSNSTAVYNPAAMDDDDQALNEESQVEWAEVEEQMLTPGTEEFSAAAIGRCTTYHSNRMEGNRRFWRINKPLWRYARYASVRFSSGLTLPRVVLAKANRTKTGVVVRPGETTPNVVAIWGRRGDKSRSVTVCLK